jgi:hypothetical protein
MPLWIRSISVLAGVMIAIFALGFAFQMPWATKTWPWADGRLSYIFYGSILAAVAAPIIWIGLSDEWAASAGGAINLGFTFAGLSWLCWSIHQRDPQPYLIRYAMGFGLFALYNVGVLIWSIRRSIHDPRKLPVPVKLSFGLFAAVLIVVGIALLRRAPTIFPWPLKPDTSSAIGFIFLGASSYFIYAMFRSRWHDARGQLYAFLAYDLILFPPYLKHFATVKPEHRLSLIVYVIVLSYSALLAIYYLFINPATRRWKSDPTDIPTTNPR